RSRPNSVLTSSPARRSSDLEVKPLAEEEMKVRFDPSGQLTHIHKSLDPATVHGEYIGAAVIEPDAAPALTEALAVTWRRDPGHRDRKSTRLNSSHVKIAYAV